MKKHLFIYLLLCLAFLGCSKDNFDGIKFSTGEEIKLTSEQQTIGLVVRSGSEWQIANPPSWCDASRRGDTLVLSPKVNDNTTERSGTVTIVNEDTQVPSPSSRAVSITLNSPSSSTSCTRTPPTRGKTCPPNTSASAWTT